MLGASKFLRRCVAPRCVALKNVSAPKYQFSARAMSTYDPSKVRNVAIIAHVDHGIAKIITCYDYILFY